MASNAFADYLRRRRTELLPSDVGLPSGGRRRTPGLRREEVAVRAGVSADYLARLEQGRDTNPSAAVVEALADALLLDDKERAVFGWLALTSSHAGRCPESPPAPDRVPETIETILAALEPNPAFVLGRRLDVLGWNNAWADFVTPLGMLDDPAEVNLAHYTYTHPMARRVLRNWAETADIFADALRRAALRWPGDAELRRTLEALREHPHFDGDWRPRRPGTDMSGVLGFDHPDHGRVDVSFEMMEADREQTLVIWLLDREQASAPALRLVRSRAAGE
ncbi:helix-turn-helix transcriptional regulator [Nocardia paucivorans]|uniref:helix-turn-helix transcriptional regulator n=1 Tax=Nocardia paucivorans TaxID=114259 RepID=UPI00031B9FFC|nr:helix-turn-helix transcriptional regulator [Nocardia paucivorans]